MNDKFLLAAGLAVTLWATKVVEVIDGFDIPWIVCLRIHLACKREKKGSFNDQSKFCVFLNQLFDEILLDIGNIYVALVSNAHY